MLSTLPVALALAAAATTTHHGHHPSSWLLGGAGIIGGFAVGVTGMGGGALMTPLLVLVFKIDPKIAIASDLVSSLVMKPIGGIVHLRRGTIHWALVIRLLVGSVPAAFLGAFTLNQFGDSKRVQADIKTVLGWALIVACASLVGKSVLSRRADVRRATAGEMANTEPYVIKSVPTVLVGVAGGFIVGMTSVGSGSLMIVLLMLMYPRLSSKALVGTDLMQAVPLVAAAALGQFVFGHIDFGIAGALIAGSAPGVYLGARVSSRAPDGIVRPVLVFVLASSALALLFTRSTTGFVWAIAIGVLVGVPLWGATDATLRRSAQWEAARRSRTAWVALMAIGAPFGVGFVASVAYFGRVRRHVMAADQTGVPAPPPALP